MTSKRRAGRACGYNFLVCVILDYSYVNCFSEGSGVLGVKSFTAESCQSRGRHVAGAPNARKAAALARKSTRLNKRLEGLSGASGGMKNFLAGFLLARDRIWIPVPPLW